MQPLTWSVHALVLDTGMGRYVVERGHDGRWEAHYGDELVACDAPDALSAIAACERDMREHQAAALSAPDVSF